VFGLKLLMGGSVGGCEHFVFLDLPEPTAVWLCSEEVRIYRLDLTLYSNTCKLTYNSFVVLFTKILTAIVVHTTFLHQLIFLR